MRLFGETEGSNTYSVFYVYITINIFSTQSRVRQRKIERSMRAPHEVNSFAVKGS